MQGEFNAIKLKEGHFYITFYKSTSLRNCQYININVHFQGSFLSLLLICIQGRMNAAKAVRLVEEQLQSFSLYLNKDVIATVVDGANLIVKFRKDTCLEYVTCYAHAIYLAVCDVLYKEKAE